MNDPSLGVFFATDIFGFNFTFIQAKRRVQSNSPFFNFLTFLHFPTTKINIAAPHKEFIYCSYSSEAT